MLCRSCTRGKCTSLSTDESRIEIECPVCDGCGCSECTEGSFELDGCPNAFCSKIITSIDLIDLFEKGLPPVAGGVMDQSASFIQAARFFASEEDKVRSERISRNSY